MDSRLIIFLATLIFTFDAKSQEIDNNKIKHQSINASFDGTKPLFDLKEEQLNNNYRHLRFSALTGYREGVKSTSGLGNFDSYLDKRNGTIRTCMYNLSIQDMVTFGFYPSNRVILEVKDPRRYRYDSTQGDKIEWMRKYAYCFEFLFPRESLKDPDALINEISHFFGVKVITEKRLIDALILIRTSENDKIKTDGKSPAYHDLKGNLKNVTLDYLAGYINDVGLPPLVNETAYKGKVDLLLNIDSTTDFQVVRRALQKYDLDLKREKRELDVLIIKEQK